MADSLLTFNESIVHLGIPANSRDYIFLGRRGPGNCLEKSYASYSDLGCGHWSLPHSRLFSDRLTAPHGEALKNE